jgi:hypothetical protein
MGRGWIGGPPGIGGGPLEIGGEPLRIGGGPLGIERRWRVIRDGKKKI